MPTLYVTEPGAMVKKEYRRLLVSKSDEVLLAIPLAHVSEVVLVGWAGVTTPALLSLLDAGVGFTMVTRSGKLRGRLQPAEARNLPLRHKQYAAASDPKFILEVSRAIVTGKIKNSRTMVRRILRQRRARKKLTLQAEGHNAVELLKSALIQVPTADSLSELRGLEGSAARAYFAILRRALRSEFHFQQRTRRPPKDPSNALLSLAYSLLTNAIFTACSVAGLDPYDGFFHSNKYGRPALALDLVEEFRTIVADSVVLTVVNNGILKKKDFKIEGGEYSGYYLTQRGLKRFLIQFNRRLNTKVYHPQAGRSLTYQKIFEIQARRLRKAIEQKIPDYLSFLAK